MDLLHLRARESFTHIHQHVCKITCDNAVSFVVLVLCSIYPHSMWVVSHHVLSTDKIAELSKHNDFSVFIIPKRHKGKIKLFAS